MEERSRRLWSLTCPKSMRFSTNSIFVCSIQWFSSIASWNCFWFRFLTKICRPWISCIWLCSRIWANSASFEWAWVGIGVGLWENGLDRGVVCGGGGGVEIGGRLEILWGGGGGGIKSLGGGLRLEKWSLFISPVEGIKWDTQVDLMCGCSRTVERSDVSEALENWVKKSNGFSFILWGFRRGEDKFCELLKLSDFLLVIMDDYVLDDFPNFLGEIWC